MSLGCDCPPGTQDTSAEATFEPALKNEEESTSRGVTGRVSSQREQICAKALLQEGLWGD